jgi:hypothetical protein
MPLLLLLLPSLPLLPSTFRSGFRGPKINIKIKERERKKKTYQQLETCRVWSPCWHPAAAAAVATVAVVAVDAAVAVVVVVAVIMAVIVVVEVAVVIIIANTKNK